MRGTAAAALAIDAHVAACGAAAALPGIPGEDRGGPATTPPPAELLVEEEGVRAKACVW